MQIPTWVLPAPVLVAPGQRVSAYQLRELILRFPPDAPAGGCVLLTALDVAGKPHPEALAITLAPDDVVLINADRTAVLDTIVRLFNARDVVDLTKATLELREPGVPIAAVPATPSAGGALGGLA